MSLRVADLTGEAITPHLDALARLRIAVFRDWPYLYDGDLDYERRYLEPYRTSPGAIVVGAFDGDGLVGAATGTPMEDHAEEFAGALEAGGLVPEDVFYCAESVLLPEYRGQGAGHAFFDRREAQARRLGRARVVFCAVERPDDHPARPTGYRPLHDFWTARGYRPLQGVTATYRWRDIGDAGETSKLMQFWMRELS